MTMGIVLVACLAARIAVVDVTTSTSTLRCTSSATRPGKRSSFPREALLNENVFSLYVTEISQPLPECLDEAREF